MLKALGVSGVSFVDPATGHPLTYAGYTEFRLLDKFLKGEGIDDVLNDRRAAFSQVRELAATTGDGAWMFPVLRVFGMCHNISHLDPNSRPDFLQAARQVVDYAAQFGFYVQYTLFADAQIIMPDVGMQKDYAHRVYDAFAGCQTVLFEKANEWQKNGCYPYDIPDPPAPFLWTQGSSLDGNPPLGGHYACFHGRRDEGPKGQLASGDLAWVVHGWQDAPWDGHSVGMIGTQWYGSHCPTIHDEPIGFAENAISGKRSNNTRLAYALGVDAALHGAGGTFHSDNGIQGQPFERITLACAQAFVVGLMKTDPVQRFQGV
jgi:hypothetical protein